MGIWESLQGTAAGAGAAIGGAGQGVGAAAEKVGRAAGAAIGGAGQGVGAAAEKVRRAAGAAIGGRGQAVGAAAEKVGWAAGAAIGGTGQAVGAAAEKVGRAAGAAIGGTGQAVGAAAEKVGAGASEGARRMKEAMPDREGWERIGRIAWRITDHALAEFSRPYTGGIPVYRLLKEEVVKAGSYDKQNSRRSIGRLEGAETPDGVIKDCMTGGFDGAGFINQKKSPPNLTTLPSKL